MWQAVAAEEFNLRKREKPVSYFDPADETPNNARNKQSNDGTPDQTKAQVNKNRQPQLHHQETRKREHRKESYRQAEVPEESMDWDMELNRDTFKQKIKLEHQDNEDRPLAYDERQVREVDCAQNSFRDLPEGPARSETSMSEEASLGSILQAEGLESPTEGWVVFSI